jgi:hypothetical protein
MPGIDECMCLQVHSTVVPCPLQDSSSVGKAICDYCDKTEPAALVVMKENKGALPGQFSCFPFKECQSSWVVGHPQSTPEPLDDSSSVGKAICD